LLLEIVFLAFALTFKLSASRVLLLRAARAGGRERERVLVEEGKHVLVSYNILCARSGSIYCIQMLLLLETTIAKKEEKNIEERKTRALSND
jgi:hypothetical protein